MRLEGLLLMAMLVVAGMQGCTLSDASADVQVADAIEIVEEDEGCGCPE
jgi:hypothetical protein